MGAGEVEEENDEKEEKKTYVSFFPLQFSLTLLTRDTTACSRYMYVCSSPLTLSISHFPFLYCTRIYCSVVEPCSTPGIFTASCHRVDLVCITPLLSVPRLLLLFPLLAGFALQNCLTRTIYVSSASGLIPLCCWGIRVKKCRCAVTSFNSWHSYFYFIYLYLFVTEDIILFLPFKLIFFFCLFI